MVSSLPTFSDHAVVKQTVYYWTALAQRSIRQWFDPKPTGEGCREMRSLRRQDGRNRRKQWAILIMGWIGVAVAAWEVQQAWIGDAPRVLFTSSRGAGDAPAAPGAPLGARELPGMAHTATASHRPTGRNSI